MLAILRDTLTRTVGPKRKNPFFLMGTKKSKTRKTFSKQFFKTKKTYYKHLWTTWYPNLAHLRRGLDSKIAPPYWTALRTVAVNYLFTSGGKTGRVRRRGDVCLISVFCVRRCFHSLWVWWWCCSTTPGTSRITERGGGGVDIGRITTPMEKGSGNLINLTHTNPPWKKNTEPPSPSVKKTQNIFVCC